MGRAEAKVSGVDFLTQTVPATHVQEEAVVVGEGQRVRDDSTYWPKDKVLGQSGWPGELYGCVDRGHRHAGHQGRPENS